MISILVFEFMFMFKEVSSSEQIKPINPSKTFKRKYDAIRDAEIEEKMKILEELYIRNFKNDEEINPEEEEIISRIRDELYNIERMHYNREIVYKNYKNIVSKGNSPQKNILLINYILLSLKISSLFYFNDISERTIDRFIELLNITKSDINLIIYERFIVTLYPAMLSSIFDISSSQAENMLKYIDFIKLFIKAIFENEVKNSFEFRLGKKTEQILQKENLSPDEIYLILAQAVKCYKEFQREISEKNFEIAKKIGDTFEFFNFNRENTDISKYIKDKILFWFRNCGVKIYFSSEIELIGKKIGNIHTITFKKIISNLILAYYCSRELEREFFLSSDNQTGRNSKTLGLLHNKKHLYDFLLIKCLLNEILERYFIEQNEIFKILEVSNFCLFFRLFSKRHVDFIEDTITYVYKNTLTPEIIAKMSISCKNILRFESYRDLNTDQKSILILYFIKAIINNEDYSQYLEIFKK
ncbi:hypothetical protein H311_01141 [Anncaliia algerae PRA109]|nr:hypothetical protein H311_01141 [Anncaliia algerae PRA109]